MSRAPIDCPLQQKSVSQTERTQNFPVSRWMTYDVMERADCLDMLLLIGVIN